VTASENTVRLAQNIVIGHWKASYRGKTGRRTSGNTIRLTQFVEIGFLEGSYRNKTGDDSGKHSEVDTTHGDRRFSVKQMLKGSRMIVQHEVVRLLKFSYCSSTSFDSIREHSEGDTT
jgi:hypothetical protein